MTQTAFFGSGVLALNDSRKYHVIVARGGVRGGYEARIASKNLYALDNCNVVAHTYRIKAHGLSKKWWHLVSCLVPSLGASARKIM